MVGLGRGGEGSEMRRTWLDNIDSLMFGRYCNFEWVEGVGDWWLTLHLAFMQDYWYWFKPSISIVNPFFLSLTTANCERPRFPDSLMITPGARVDQSNYHNDVITVTCAPNHVVINGPPSANMSCDNGYWTPTMLPICKHINDT